EHASKTRDDPEGGSRAPDVVGGEQPVPARWIEGSSKGAAAGENGAEAKGHREDMDPGENRADDHGAVYRQRRSGDLDHDLASGTAGSQVPDRISTIKSSCPALSRMSGFGTP